MKYISVFISSLFCFIATSTLAQLTVTPNQPAATLANKLAGPGITISSPTLTCAGVANGTFTSTATPLGLDSGILLTSGRAVNTAGLETFLASTNNGTAGDAALTTLAGAATHDACYLEFDFIPKGDTISFNYVFGSEEYINSVCGVYNDAFAFFISGPGITGAQNMALIPGTNIPVTVNSINNGVPGPGYSMATCNSMGPGSPFTSYYTSNIGGTQLTYRGYTVPMRAYHSVTPCSTYHLKMTVADAGNSLYDSGVFIEAGSLQTNTYYFDHSDSMGATIGGVPYTFVKGCNPAVIEIKSAHAVGTAQTVHFSYGGTALHSTDFSAPDSATIPAGDTAITVNITGINTPVGGSKTVEIYLQSPFSCGYVDTVVLTLLDSPSASILTPDTAICIGQSAKLRGTGTAWLAYSWSPGTGLTSTTAMQPIATPITSTTYSMTATLAAAGCTPIVRTVHVTVNVGTVNILTPDTAVCNGASVHIMVAPGGTGTTYTWTPGTGLNSTTLMNPTATPATTTTYSVVAVDPANGCPGTDHITITIFTPNAHILTPDTSICTGASVMLRVSAVGGLAYDWTPNYALDNNTLQQPTATPGVNTTYTMKATVPGTPCFTTDNVTVTVIPPVPADAGSGKAICQSVPIQLGSFPSGINYSYSWTGPGGFTSGSQNPYIDEATIVNSGTYTVTVTDNNTTCLGTDTVTITVDTSSIILQHMTPSQVIKYGSSIQLYVDNAQFYYWTPGDGTLSDPNINNPIATPLEKTLYTVYGISNEGCRDTAYVTIDVEHDNTEFIPSGFTPNGDKRNDVFRPVGSQFHKLVDFRVYNRWGQEIFSTSDPTMGWDGTYNGTPQDMGVYQYVIIIANTDASNTVYKGNVTLIR